MLNSAPDRERLRVVLRGLVQGVGFRPFVHRLAANLGLAGWVANCAEGVFIEVEGDADCLDRFLTRLPIDKPPRASIQSLEPTWLDPEGFTRFEIRPSLPGLKTALIMPDIAACDACLADISDPFNRRYGYPFTTCTHCGPRYSIIETLPYDRPGTTMRRFSMCARCQAEYDNPADRRFHAQPNACPDCGPRLRLVDREGKTYAQRGAALDLAVQALAQGQILALKGLGGFHLCVDAQNDEAVRELRRRKQRAEKPFALMIPSLVWAKSLARLSSLEERLFESPEAPIVLVPRREGGHGEGWKLSGAVAPGNPHLGLMRPYTPLHALLLQAFPYPIVATSGNHMEEPICIDEQAALVDLKGLADLFLVHNRPIARPVDDSIVRVVGGREMVLRRARGYAPLPAWMPAFAAAGNGHPPVIGVGGHLKNTVALAIGAQVVLSQHIGNLETMRSLESFRNQIAALKSLYECEPGVIACDDHPDYLSTVYAHRVGLPIVSVQHHHAHVLSGMADNALAPPVLGVAWDGSGYGLDQTVWGGEFLGVTEKGFERLGYLKPFRLPGSEKAVKEPRRSALGMLFEIFGSKVVERRDLAPVRMFTDGELSALTGMLSQNLQTPLTTSAGRLFDAVASVLDVRHSIEYEGQAAMLLEWRATNPLSMEPWPFEIRSSGGAKVVDWEPMIRAMIEGIVGGREVPELAGRFHRTLIEMIVETARRCGLQRVMLTGGCFQNRALTEGAISRLRQEGFKPYWHQRIPPNDGGLAVGQVWAARIRLQAASEVRRRMSEVAAGNGNSTSTSDIGPAAADAIRS